MNNKHYKIVAFILLTIVVASFTHCVQNAPVGGSSSSSSSRSPSGTPAQTPEQVINTAQVDVGLKNFEQINYTFSELTGIPVTNGTISSTYNAVESTLPTENEIKVLQSSNQVAITRLAAEYCNQIGNTAGANRDIIFGANVFTTTSNNVNIMDVVTRITNQFWGGSGIVPAAELTDARNDLLDLYADILAMDTGTQNTTALTSKGVKAVCTAALSSAYVTVM